MSVLVTFDNFQQELARLVDKFDRDYPQFIAANYNEATLRNEFLDPFSGRSAGTWATSTA